MHNKLIVRTFFSTAKNCKKVALNNLKNKGSSSTQWLTRQLSDPYVEKAKMMNYRCRSAFKLIEIDDRFKFLRPGQIVIDCGAAPGSWTQVAIDRVNSNSSNLEADVGTVISIDKQQFFPMKGATILGNSDFTHSTTQDEIKRILNNKLADVVISDMAPSATGVREMDCDNILKLCYSALRFAILISNTNASLLVKLWQSGEAKILENDMSRFYESVKYVKPNASRSDSSEIFMLARNFKGLKKS